MKILKNQGSFEILTSLVSLSEAALLVEKAGRTCYQSERQEITTETAGRFIKMLLRRGHESVLEHSLITVQFNNCSRGFTHELVRHRLASFSQESTRFVDYLETGGEVDLDKFQIEFITPPHRDENQNILLEDGTETSLCKMAEIVESFYRGLRKAGWKPEDARQILPIGLKSQIVTSANFRQWRHIFSQRTTKPAHWEIRTVMCNLLEKLKDIIPVVFDDFVEAGVDKNGCRYFKMI